MNRQITLAVVLLAGLAGGALAAGLEAGKGEVSGFAGGVHVASGGGTHGAFGGTVGGAVHKNVFVFGEFTYVPLGGADAFLDISDLGTIVRADVSARLVDFGGGVHISIPTGNEKVVPYAVGGVGVSRSSASGSVTAQVPGRTTTISFDESSTDFGVNGGFGLRFYVKDNWGFRPEFKIARYFVEGGGITVARFTAGVFYQFGKK